MIELALGPLSSGALCREAFQMAQVLRSMRHGGPASADVGELRSKSPLESLRRSLRRLFPVLLDGVAFSRLHASYELDYVMRQELDAVTFLSVQGMVEAFSQRMEPKILRRNSVMLMHRGLIVWSSFAFDEAKVLARYLNRAEASGVGVLGDSGEGFLRVGSLLSTVGDTGGHQVSKLCAPLMHIGQRDVARLVAYRKRELTLVFALAAVSLPTGDDPELESTLAQMLAKVDRLISVDLTQLAKLVEVTTGRVRSVSDAAETYFSRNAVDSTLTLSPALWGPALGRMVNPGEFLLALEGPVLRTVDKVVVLLRGSSCANVAFCVLNESGEPVWVCGRRSDSRIVLLVLTGPRPGSSLLAALPDVHYEFARLLDGPKFRNAFV